jgi:hypothetical protein
MADYSKQIWDYLVAKIGNEYGVAGLMGNLKAESGLHPDRKQGDIPYSSVSQEYTANVDNGTYSEYSFVHDSIGFGLAQWTYYNRKQNLYNLSKQRNVSIGNITLGLDFLWSELTGGYSGVTSVLISATSVLQASNKVLFDFENPADQSKSVQTFRASLGQAIYDKYTGTSPVDPNEPPDPIDPPEPDPTPTGVSLYSLIYKTPYKVGQLKESNITLLKQLEVGDTIKTRYTFNHNKRQVGINSNGKRLTFTTLDYIILSVERNGFIMLSHDGKKNNASIINPLYLKGVTTL